MTNLSLFRFDTREVRTLLIDGEPWFVGKDVAELFGYANAADALNRHCKGVQKLHPLPTSGGVQEVRVIAEPDVWRLIVGSHLPEAQRIERWIFEEVLPTIRRTGTYPTQPAGLTAAQTRAHQQRLQILRDLDASPGPSPTRRTALHAQLASVSEALGLPTPPLSAFEPTPLPDPFDRVRQAFWQAVAVLESAYGVQLNHHSKVSMCAYNLPEVYALASKHGIPLPSKTEMSRALASDRRFIQYKGVSSNIRKMATKCFCFRTIEAQQAIDETCARQLPQ